MKGFLRFIALIVVLVVIFSIIMIGGKHLLNKFFPESSDSETSSDVSQPVKEEKLPDLEVLSPEEKPAKEENEATQTVHTLQDDWALVLANPSHPVPDNWTVDVEHLQNNKEADKRVLPYAKQMMKDAQADGIELLIASAYRSVSYQEGLFERSIENYKSQGCSEEEALQKTKNYYSVPGYSEHHTGLALDIVTPSYQMLNDGYAETDAAKWLLENAHKYGFILRYPKDKEELTNINFEPWHYRYVGEEHAAYMKEHNLCLEEYLELRA